jgi:hypothetical protein
MSKYPFRQKDKSYSRSSMQIFEKYKSIEKPTSENKLTKNSHKDLVRL